MLHVANGTSTTRTIADAGLPGATSIWADPLHDGPVPAGLSDAALMDVRARHRAACAGQAGDQPAAPAVSDALNELRAWRAAIDRHAGGEVILWFEHDLFDQLNLVQLLSWMRPRPAAAAVSLVCVGAFPGRPGFKGLGELTPSELASLLPSRRRVDAAQFALAERAWQAFRAPTPEALDALRRTDTTALPFLAAAVTRFLQEYPWTTDGLSRSERRLLALAEGGPIALSGTLPRMHAGEDAYYITDTSLAALAADLAGSVPPLLALTRRSAGDARADDDALQGSVTLTETGRAVAAGVADRVATCGLDRWLGGVHLQSGRDEWRWDDDRQRVVRG